MTIPTTTRPLEGKLAIVTGASRGECSRYCSIFAVYTSQPSTKLTADLCLELTTQYGVQAHAVQADLSQPETAPSAIVQAAKEHFSKNGRLLVNILINNAGVGGDYPLEKVPVEEFHRVYGVNVLAPIRATQAVVPCLPHDRSGRIINI